MVFWALTILATFLATVGLIAGRFYTYGVLVLICPAGWCLSLAVGLAIGWAPWLAALAAIVLASLAQMAYLAGVCFRLRTGARARVFTLRRRPSFDTADSA